MFKIQPTKIPFLTFTFRLFVSFSHFFLQDCSSTWSCPGWQTGLLNSKTWRLPCLLQSLMRCCLLHQPTKGQQVTPPPLACKWLLPLPPHKCLSVSHATLIQSLRKTLSWKLVHVKKCYSPLLTFISFCFHFHIKINYS